MAIMKTTLTLALLLSLPALAGPKEELSKPLTTIVNSVRYGRDNAARPIRHQQRNAVCSSHRDRNVRRIRDQRVRLGP